MRKLYPLLVGLVFWGISKAPEPRDTEKAGVPKAPEPKDNTEKAAESATRATVQVTVKGRLDGARTQCGVGSGVLIGLPAQYKSMIKEDELAIITASYVAGTNFESLVDTAEVRFVVPKKAGTLELGESIPARVVYASKKREYAILAINNKATKALPEPVKVHLGEPRFSVNDRLIAIGVHTSSGPTVRSVRPLQVVKATTKPDVEKTTSFSASPHRASTMVVEGVVKMGDAGGGLFTGDGILVGINLGGGIKSSGILRGPGLFTDSSYQEKAEGKMVNCQFSIYWLTDDLEDLFKVINK